jgi:hypothetical protein
MQVAPTRLGVSFIHNGSVSEGLALALRARGRASNL